MLIESTCKQILLPWKEKFEHSLDQAVQSLGEQSPLKQACVYALKNGGKRLRPIIVCITAEAIGKNLPVMEAALSVEFFHTASLIADDLPCMDNDDFRRDHPSLHKKFGESVAILASYTLIALGYEYIHHNSSTLKQKGISADVCLVALEKASKAAGLKGATGGQYYDLFPKDQSAAHIELIAERKTATLFDIAFSFGWIFGGGDLDKLPIISKCANHFGLAFQLADDWLDYKQDQNGNNLVQAMGKDKSWEKFQHEIFQFEENAKRLGLTSQAFDALIFSVRAHMENTSLKPLP
jgi:geranylgeranyl diphosphate synthase, type II